ncbi:fungal-specific transcription factor domain-containing protein [Ilyonectria robusta]|uniref:fungal-specific transcription factor domain-containing protein n=1 Tax=Ilyonectria robusta TaxID=1079257 RepID=UPI001E8DA416|nr:fungal-specific transcription factor domain-containing protein [Ilyonectria robusta]KAH8661733.1 fungal-specific transcription factor domain-containing protein [Ilyonectria robusta]
MGSATMAPARHSRSFTLSQPPLTKRQNKPRIKRSKTYTGCWTCRARGIKCDEQKPECGRCLRSNLRCAGYHVKLVWDVQDGEAEKPAKRRAFLTAHDARQPVLSASEIRLALAEADVADARNPVQSGPFTVFSASVNPETPRASSETPEEDDHNQDNGACVETSTVWCHDLGEIDIQAQDRSGRDVDHAVMKWMHGIDHEHHHDTKGVMTMVSIKQKVFPHIPAYISSASKEERSLFHDWVTVLSGLMMPTQYLDNPFRTIFIPLALAAPSSSSESSGNGALLHSIYAISAFNQAQLSSSNEYLFSLGTKHHRIALEHLRRSLMQPEESQTEAILATIINMSSIDVIKGQSASWRIHHAGGWTWLQHIMENGATQSANASVLCQIFFCISTLGQSHPEVMSRLERRQGIQPKFAYSMQVWDKPYALDRLFGITQPVLEGIMRTNTLSEPVCHATQEEIEDLDLFIRRNDPDVLISDMEEEYDDITRHHTCTFFCASLIYFERRLRKTSPRKIQRLVQRSLDHLCAIDALEVEQKLVVCGLFWPVFVTACEAENFNNLRARALQMFDKGTLLGIGNILSARKVVEEVWRRRDNDCEGVDTTWQSVMADLELDLILT